VEKAFKLRALMLVDPASAKAQVVAALEASAGNLPSAAEALGISHRTMSRWVVELGLERRVERLRAKARPPRAKCSTRGCKRDAFSRGLCSSHYAGEWRRRNADRSSA